MRRVHAVAIDTACTFDSPVDVTQVPLESGTLTILLTAAGDGKAVVATFDEVTGVRMFDEGGRP